MADFPQRSLKVYISGGLVLAVCGVLSGCGDGKEYQIPDSLCGVPVDPDLVEPLLSPGERASQKVGGDSQKYTCSVRVGDRIPLSVSSEWRSTEISALEVAKERFNHHATTFLGEKYAVWPEGASAVFECRNTEKKAKQYSIMVRTTESDDREASKEAMKRFIVAYAEEFAKTLPCEGQ